MMTLNTKTPTNGETLTAIREYAHHTINDVAYALTVEPDTVIAWENNTEHPTLKQLRQLAAIYDVNTAVLLASNPVIVNHLPTFPMFNGNPVISKELHKEIRKALWRREVFLDFRSSQVNPLEKLFTKNVSPSREHLFQAWITVVEHNKNTLVFQTDTIPIEEFHGLSIYNPTISIIILNARNTTSQQGHSLLHQLGHLQYQHNKICVDHYSNNNEKKQYCDMIFDIPNDTCSYFLSQHENISEPTREQKIIRNFGPSYTTTILDAINKEKISELDGTYYLDVNIHEIESIRKKLFNHDT